VRPRQLSRDSLEIAMQTQVAAASLLRPHLALSPVSRVLVSRRIAPRARRGQSRDLEQAGVLSGHIADGHHSSLSKVSFLGLPAEPCYAARCGAILSQLLASTLIMTAVMSSS
jgi:hypothetical protein